MRRRVISIALALLMLVGMLPTGIGAAVEDNLQYSKEISVLKSLGMLEAFENLPKETTELTRAEFISIVMPVLYQDIEKRSFQGSPFEDVTEDTPYYNYICAAYEADVIHGDNGKFLPMKKITYTEVIRILVDILGYNAIVNQYGGFPGGYLKVAGDIKLTKDVKAGNDEVVSFGKAAVLYVNALNTEMYGITDDGNGITLKKSVKTLLETKLDIYKDEGILRENTYTSLENIDGSGVLGEVTIGDYTGHIYKSLLPEKYFGYYVEYYYNDDDGEILYIEPVERKNEIIKLADSEIDSFSFSDRQIVYTLGGRDRSYRKTIPIDAVVIYNGKNKPVYTEENLMPKNGDVTLIDNDGNGKIDVVVVNDYKTIFVGAIDKEEKIVVDYYDNSSKLDLSEDRLKDRSIIIADKSSEMMSVDDIEKYDVITAVVSDDESYVRCVVSKNSKEGTVSGTYAETDGKAYISLSDSTEYEVGSGFLNYYKNICNIGVNGTLYIDINGRACGFINSTIFTEYGFYIKAYTDENEDIYIKLMNIYGDIVTMKAAKKLKIDGISTSKSEDLPLNSQVVRYTTNSAGEIRLIDTAKKTANEGDGTLHSILGDGFVNEKFYNAYKSFRAKLWVDDKTIFILAPSNPQGASDVDYVIGNYKLLNDEKYNFKGYNTSLNSVTPQIVHVDISGSTAPNLTNTSYDGIVADICETLNSDEEPVTEVSIITYKLLRKERLIL